MKTTLKPQLQVSSDSLIRQLIWCVTSPPLVSASIDNTWPNHNWPNHNWYEQQREQLLPLLTSLAVDAEPLHAFINNERDVRLGARFERFLEFWMEQHPAIEVLARRLQYTQEGRTFGEFDFLVHTALGREPHASNDKQTEHWEVACKFYLGLPLNNQMHWIGPGKRDRLVRKLERIQTHQLMLSQRDGARRMLSARDINVDATRGLLKGRLFYPWSEHETPVLACEPLPGELTLQTSHERGYWCDVNSRALDNAHSIVLLPKNVWLDPQLQIEGEQVDRVALGELVKNAPQCCDVQTADGVGMRLFVVAPGWFDDVPASLFA